METQKCERQFTFRCDSCGRTHTAGYGRILHRCPDCGGTLLFDGENSSEMQVDFVVPFAIRERELTKIVRRYMGRFYTRPLLMRRSMTVRKQFVPFYLFYSRADGTVMFRCARYDWDTKTNYRYEYTAYCAGEMELSAICVDASEAMPDGMMDELEPFDLNAAQQTIPDIDSDAEIMERTSSLNECIRRARELSVLAAARDAGRHLAMRDIEVLRDESNLDESETRVYSVLLPVYSVAFTAGKNVFSFAVNGQTGEVTGERTQSGWRKAAFGTALLAAPFPLLLLIHFLKYGTASLSGYALPCVILELLAGLYAFILLRAANTRLNAPGVFASHISRDDLKRLHISSHLNSAESDSIFKEKHYWRAIGQLAGRVLIVLLKILVRLAIELVLSGGHGHGGSFSSHSTGHSSSRSHGGGGSSRGAGAGRGR